MEHVIDPAVRSQTVISVLKSVFGFLLIGTSFGFDGPGIRNCRSAGVRLAAFVRRSVDFVVETADAFQDPVPELVRLHPDGLQHAEHGGLPRWSLS